MTIILQCWQGKQVGYVGKLSFYANLIFIGSDYFTLMKKPKPLSKKEIENNLKKLPGWAFKDDKISKEFKFNDFLDSFNFIKSLVPFFQKMDHHPDIHIFYSRVLFELQRFDIGGKVTDRDIVVAKKIEEKYGSR